MKILILEDDPRRVEIFKRNLSYGSSELLIVDKVDECISALKEKKWDALFLDHDLGGKVYVTSDGDEPTGWHVAKWLSEHPDRKPDPIIVHSFNPVGRKNIIDLLPEALDAPGAWLTAGIKEGR